MKKARLEDKNLVVDILTDAYHSNPQVDFLLKKTINKSKLRTAMEYIFDLAFHGGEIYLNEDNTAVALWDTSNKRKFSFRQFFQEIKLTLQLGFDSTIRVLRLNKIFETSIPEKQNFARLYAIAVKPEGKGYTKKLIDYMSEKMSQTKATLFLDTSTASEIGTLNKFGFHVFKAVAIDNQKLFFMQKPC
ncbi:MAG: hypothetical protein PHH37_01930 [Paludibacter sp.]|nr:hypothetical protein [Paludibacter sp.]